MTQKIILNTDTYSKDWSTDNDNGAFWLLEKKDLEMALNVSKFFLSELKVDDNYISLYYCFLITDINIALSALLETGKVFSVRMIDQPFEFDFLDTSIIVSGDGTDKSKIDSGLFYLYGKVLIDWTVNVDPNYEIPLMTGGISEQDLNKIGQIIESYAIS